MTLQLQNINYLLHISFPIQLEQKFQIALQCCTRVLYFLSFLTNRPEISIGKKIRTLLTSYLKISASFAGAAAQYAMRMTKNTTANFILTQLLKKVSSFFITSLIVVNSRKSFTEMFEDRSCTHLFISMPEMFFFLCLILTH